MSLKLLFESLDEKVFTPELKESLEAQFNEAVETKATAIAEARIEQEIDALNEKSEQHIEMLNEKAEEFKASIKEEMVNSLDKYLDRVVEEFVSEAQGALEESVKSEKADMVLDAYESMLIATGVKVAQIVEAKNESSLENKLNESVEKYDALVEEVISLKEENERLIKLGLVNEMKDGLSLVEAEKFERLAELVEFSRDEAFAKKLETIKENVKGAAEKQLEESVEDQQEENKPSWAHLI